MQDTPSIIEAPDPVWSYEDLGILLGMVDEEFHSHEDHGDNP